jgi:ABC-2 type transport system ATP-binding protein
MGLESDDRGACAPQTDRIMEHDPDLAAETVGLTKRFGERTALDQVSLTVPTGVAFGFLGPNGSGKTTLIRLLMGLAEPTVGSARLLGLDLPESRAPALARVGAIIEEPRFHDHLSGRHNLVVLAAAREPAAMERIGAALERVGLANRADDKVSGYSLGMRQRLGVAQCLLADPELLILDEPMNGLDPAGIQDMRRLIGEFVAEGRTVLLSSHLLDEVEKTCDMVAIVDNGRIVDQGLIEDIVRKGSARTAEIQCDDRPRATQALAGLPHVVRATDDGHMVLVELAEDAPEAGEMLTAVLRTLIEAGFIVNGAVAGKRTLEERFLKMTTRLEDRA